MKYGADDVDGGHGRGATAWCKIAEEHLAIAQDIFADLYSGGSRGTEPYQVALAQAHSLQALALLYGWSK